MARGQRGRRWWAFAALFTLFAGEAFRNTLSWYGFAAWAVVLTVLGGALLAEQVRTRVMPPLRAVLRSPAGVLLGAFLLWATLSLLWSDYPGATLLAVAVLLVTTLTAATLVTTLGWRGVLDALFAALSAIVALSLLFELAVEVYGRPVLPVFPINVTPGDDVPDSFYWSRALLFEGGRIQGILGNANLLAFVALLLLVVAACRLAAHSGSRSAGWAAVALAIGALALTRSSTVLVSAISVALVLLILLVGRRSRLAGWAVAAGAAGLLVAGGAVAAPVILSRSDDLTGRIDIWTAVTALFFERPLLGWGWTSYWQPWVPLFQELAVRKGVVYLQAHNAYLDVAFQLGVIGGALFLALAAAVGVAVVRRGLPVEPTAGAQAADAARSTWVLGRALPGLLLAALLTQALAESRLLVEGNWALLCVIAVAAAGVRPGHDRPAGYAEA